MMCYKDRTYCIAECNNFKCPDKLTEIIKQEAEDFGLPVAMADYSKSCSIHIPKETKDESRK